MSLDHYRGFAAAATHVVYGNQRMTVMAGTPDGKLLWSARNPHNPILISNRQLAAALPDGSPTREQGQGI